MTPRPATSNDVETLAQIHVQSWHEAYHNLLTPAEIAAQTIEKRRALWGRVLAQNQSRVWLLDDLGFAQFGPQHEAVWRDKGYSEELYAIYLRKAGFGQGRTLLQAAFGPDGLPFTTCVLDGNARACAFYEKAGGQHLITRQDDDAPGGLTERVYGWLQGYCRTQS
jgi:hypothetical protein